MLRVLSVRDYVIAERVELEPAAAFGVLSGETGAGKSILVDALELLVGGRAESTCGLSGTNANAATPGCRIGPWAESA